MPARMASVSLQLSSCLPSLYSLLYSKAFLAWHFLHSFHSELICTIYVFLSLSPSIRMQFHRVWLGLYYSVLCCNAFLWPIWRFFLARVTGGELQRFYNPHKCITKRRKIYPNFLWLSVYTGGQWTGFGFRMQTDQSWNTISATYKLNDSGKFNKYININNNVSSEGYFLSWTFYISYLNSIITCKEGIIT